MLKYHQHDLDVVTRGRKIFEDREIRIPKYLRQSMDFVKKASSTLRFNLKGDPTHFEACKDLEVCLLGLVVVRSEPELLLRMECLWAEG